MVAFTGVGGSGGSFSPAFARSVRTGASEAAGAEMTMRLRARNVRGRIRDLFRVGNRVAAVAPRPRKDNITEPPASFSVSGGPSRAMVGLMRPFRTADP